MITRFGITNPIIKMLMINDLLSGSAQEGEQLKEIKIQMDVILITNNYITTPTT